MRVDFDVGLLDREGMPQAHVPAARAWDLVDYLAQQRVQVTYSFEAERLVVNFHHMSMDSARDILDVWQHTGDHENAEHGPLPSSDRWVVGTRHSL
jgi:hypothetical protein